MLGYARSPTGWSATELRVRPLCEVQEARGCPRVEGTENGRGRGEGSESMSVFMIGKIYYYDFWHEGRRYKKSTCKTSKQAAERVERDARTRLVTGYAEVIQQEQRALARRQIGEVADEFLESYKARHRAPAFAGCALAHVKRLLGDQLVQEITDSVYKRYQNDRLGDGAGEKSINDETALLLRLCGDQGDLLRVRLRREKALKLKVQPSPGKPYSVEEQERMLAVARQSTESARRACERQARGEGPTKGEPQGGSPSIYPALMLALRRGMRAGEVANLTLGQIDWAKKILTVGHSKTDAGTGRTIPLDGDVLDALADHLRWHASRFGAAKPAWFLFPGGGRSPKDPTMPIKSLKTAWDSVRKKAGVSGRWHDTRHTLITELAESGAGDETIMGIAGHVSRQMLARYSHIRTEAKRKALEGAERQRAEAREGLAKERLAKETPQSEPKKVR